MDWVLFAVVELVVLGGTALALLVAYEGIKCAQAEKAESGSGLAEPVKTPRFFARTRNREDEVRAPAIKDVHLARLEEFLSAEMEQAEEFVSRPSFASLYENSERRYTFN